MCFFCFAQHCWCKNLTNCILFRVLPQRKNVQMVHIPNDFQHIWICSSTIAWFGHHDNGLEVSIVCNVVVFLHTVAPVHIAWQHIYWPSAVGTVRSSRRTQIFGVHWTSRRSTTNTTTNLHLQFGPIKRSTYNRRGLVGQCHI